MSNFKKNNWRVVIHFLKKEGLKPSEAAKKLQLHYGDSAPDIPIISCLLSRFAAYRESLEDVVLKQQPRFTQISILRKVYLMEIGEQHT